MVTTLRPVRLPRFARALAGLCAVAIWLLGVLAISPELHGHLHADAATAHHECAVTLFQQGVEDPVSGESIAVEPIPAPVHSLVVPEFLPRDASDLRLNHGRGPPRR